MNLIMKKFLVSFFLILFGFTISSSLTAKGHVDVKYLNEQLVMGTLWYQTSAEMRALSYQAFNMGKLVYDLDMKANKGGKKRAVAVDIDETVLDNSPYEAGLVGMNYGYSKGWKEWIAHAKAKALPGAVEFLNYVDSKGGAVFYISNRKIRGLEATMKNLKELGFPQVTKANVLLRTKSSNKQPRRDSVNKHHRVVLAMGDNLNDFSNIFRKKGVEDRAKAVDSVKEKFGMQFIVLPNPMYGDWEGAAYKYNWGATAAEKDNMRKKNLKIWRH